MKTKTIPFDLEIAKKIQAGEIKGKINTRYGQRVSELLVFQTTTRDLYVVYANIDGKIHSFNADGYERIWDKSNHWEGDLVLEVPCNEPQKRQFNPFDKVLVRVKCGMWQPRLFDSYVAGKYWAQDGVAYDYCIHYNDNEYLIGTDIDPKEE